MPWALHQDPDLTPLAAVWAAACAAGTHSVFQSFAFARHWAAAFAEATGLRIWWHADPPFIVPLLVRQRRLSLVGEGLFDYLDLVGAAPEELQRAAAGLAREEAWSEAQFTGVPEASRFSAFWRALGIKAESFAAAPLRAPGSDPACEHPRLAARWRAAKVELRAASEPAARRRLLDWMLEHKARNLAVRGQANVLGESERCWLEAMVEAEPDVCELWALVRGGQTLSGLLCWRSPAVRYAYTISYDRQAAALSPGILALFAVLRHTMKEGRSFNFLTGEQAFKQRFATHREPLLRYRCERGAT